LSAIRKIILTTRDQALPNFFKNVW